VYVKDVKSFPDLIPRWSPLPYPSARHQDCASRGVPV